MIIQKSVNGEETLLLLVRMHWIQYAMPAVLIATSWLLYVLCALLSVTFMGQNASVAFAVLMIGHLLLLLFHHAAFYQIFTIRRSGMVISNLRILVFRQHLWGGDTVSDVPLWKIRSIEVKKRGILQHIFNIGSIAINNGELPDRAMIRNPDTVHASIMVQVQHLQSSAHTSWGAEREQTLFSQESHKVNE